MNSKPNNRERFGGVVKRAFPECGLRVIDDENRIVELSFSSEKPVERWGDFEVLSHKSGAVDLTRINSTGCLLFNHNRDKVIGKIVEAKVKNKRGVAKVQFDSDDDSTVIYEKVRGGTLKGVSVGYIIHEVEKKTQGKGSAARITYTATLWEPLEISIVSVPADISVGVGRSIIEHEPRTPKLNIAKRQIQINNNKFREEKRK